jgi:hypothetical protein
MRLSPVSLANQAKHLSTKKRPKSMSFFFFFFKLMVWTICHPPHSLTKKKIESASVIYNTPNFSNCGG